MNRNLKALGLTLVAAFALCAAITPAASADEFKAEKTPVTLTGEYDALRWDAFVTTYGVVECDTGKLTGTIAAGGSPTSALTMTPTYSGCFYDKDLFPTVIDLNGCDYRYTINVGASTAGSLHIICPKVDGVTQEIKITVGVPGTLKCTIDIPEQTLATGITYKNIGAGAMREITVEILVKALEYKETAGTGLGACKNSLMQNNGVFEGKEVISGEEDPGLGARIGVYVE
jgi:hypothetical protein